jgi:hypothetical protein
LICFFCFYNKSTGIQSKLAFSELYRHCNIITYDGDIWLAHEFDHTGLINKRIKVYKSTSLLRGLKYIDSLISLIIVHVHTRAKHSWKPYIVRSCNELDRYIAGVDTGFTFNPKHLYNKLIKNHGTNYEILYHWRR